MNPHLVEEVGTDVAGLPRMALQRAITASRSPTTFVAVLVAAAASPPNGRDPRETR